MVRAAGLHGPGLPALSLSDCGAAVQRPQTSSGERDTGRVFQAEEATFGARAEDWPAHPYCS